jgi:hypothetical protein
MTAVEIRAIAIIIDSNLDIETSPAVGARREELPDTARLSCRASCPSSSGSSTAAATYIVRRCPYGHTRTQHDVLGTAVARLAVGAPFEKARLLFGSRRVQLLPEPVVLCPRALAP